jgi:diamine N-acetyltransferase
MEINYLIRKAEPGDADQMAELAIFTFREAWLEPGNEADLEEYVRENFAAEVLRKELRNPDITYLEVSINEEPVGYAKLEKRCQPDNYLLPGPVALHRLYIKAAFRNHKLGSELLKHVMSLSKQEGFKTLWLGVWNENYNAMRFYSRFGFEKFGEYVFTMGKIKSDDYLMKVDL